METTSSTDMLDEYINKWRVLINTLPNPISIIDTEFNIVLSNEAMMDLFDKKTLSQNTKCFQLFHNLDKPIKECPAGKSKKSGKIEQSEIYESFLDKHLKICATPIIEENKTIGFVHSIIDITEQKHTQENNESLIEVYSNTINKLKTQATSAQKGRDAFLNMLEDINESYGELEELFMKLILVMVNSLDAKSPWTKGHSERVSLYAEQIATEMLIDSDEVKDIKLAGLLHDIGKIGTYDYLLDKPGKLTREEFDIVKKHPSQGADILKGIKQLKTILPYIRYHHEKLDGNGYPDKLSGSQIPLGARILHVADSFDSMTSDRPYRPAPGIDYALAEFEKYKCTQFDEKIVDAFLKVLQKNNGVMLP